MVYTKGSWDELTIRHNVTFLRIPKRLVELLEIDYEWFLNATTDMELSRTCWNIVVEHKEEVVAACWGHVDPLEHLVHIVRVVVAPEWQTPSGRMLRLLMLALGTAFPGHKVFFITDRAKAYMRKLPLIVWEDAKVMEVCYD